MSPPLRVLRLIARLNVGGPARHVAWLTAGLRPLGFETTLVTGTVPPGEQDMTDFVRAQGVEPLTLPGLSREISWRDLPAIWRTYRLMRRLRPEIVHTHTSKAGFVGRCAVLLYRWLTPGTLWLRPRRCRVVHTFHGHVFRGYYGPRKTRLILTIERVLARLATDRIVVLSPRLYREICEEFRVGRPQQFVVIPLGLDLDVFRDGAQRRPILRQELGAADDETLVGIVGRLTEIKNHDLFLRAAVEFLRQHSPPDRRRVRFVVIGDGPLRPELERRAEELGLGNSAVFLGMRSDPEVFYPGLDLVALTSLNEGTPLSLIEAMASERAVVSTGVGGVPDLLGSASNDDAGAADGYRLCERGLMVESPTAASFAAALARLIADADLRRRLGETGRAYVETHYSKERLLHDVAALYRDLLRE